MKLDIKMVEKIAELSRLDLSTHEQEKLLLDLTKILHYVSKLESISVADVEPTYNIVEEENFFREDHYSPKVPNETLLKNAPETQGDFVQVPLIIDSHE